MPNQKVVGQSIWTWLWYILLQFKYIITQILENPSRRMEPVWSSIRRLKARANGGLSEYLLFIFLEVCNTPDTGESYQIVEASLKSNKGVAVQISLIYCSSSM